MEAIAAFSANSAGVEPKAGAVLLPRISIVIPTFNGAAYLEQCIGSIVEQQYPDVECIVIDGGSTDGSREILRKYEHRLTYWVSEKDRGQSHAINKGFARATGEVLNWLGSDDRLLPGALQEIGRRFAEDPTLDVLVGGCYMRHLHAPERNGPTWTHPDSLPLIPLTNPINQPSCFFRRRVLRAGNVVDESYHYAMDTELWSYLRSKPLHWKFTQAVLSEYLWTGDNKTMTGGEKILQELHRLCRDYRSAWEMPLLLLMRQVIHPLDKYAVAHPPAVRQRMAAWCRDLSMKVLGRIYGFDRYYALFNTYNFFDPGTPASQ